MRFQLYFRVFALTIAAAITSCSSIQHWSKIRLFPGLDEQKITPANQRILAQAKADFEQVRLERSAIHAKLVKPSPGSRTRVYQGEGYNITFYTQDTTKPYAAGPVIVIAASITGGSPYRYDEIMTEPAIE